MSERDDNKKTCMECGKYVRNLRRHRNLFLCYNCYSKYFTKIPNEKSLYEVLEKVYHLKLHKNGYCHINLPKVLADKKVKLEIVNE